jgi:hypothetical protein
MLFSFFFFGLAFAFAGPVILTPLRYTLQAGLHHHTDFGISLAIACFLHVRHLLMAGYLVSHCKARTGLI